MAFVGAFVAYCDYLGYTELHFPPGEGTPGFLDTLKDSIDIMDMFPDKSPNSKVLRDDPIV